jgi:hypothetical protein
MLVFHPEYSRAASDDSLKRLTHTLVSKLSVCYPPEKVLVGLVVFYECLPSSHNRNYIETSSVSDLLGGTVPKHFCFNLHYKVEC